MREDDAKHADVEHLLGDPLIHLAAVGRNPHHGRHPGGQPAALQNLASVQHVLQGIPQSWRAHRRMLHLERYAVVGRASQHAGRLDVHRGESDKGRLALFQGSDNTIEARNL